MSEEKYTAPVPRQELPEPTSLTKPALPAAICSCLFCLLLLQKHCRKTCEKHFYKSELPPATLPLHIHPASRGVAAHTAGLFRSVRGAKGGVEYEEQFPREASQAKNFHFPPPWGLPKLGNFHFSPPWGLPKLGNFHFSPP